MNRKKKLAAFLAVVIFVALCVGAWIWLKIAGLIIMLAIVVLACCATYLSNKLFIKLVKRDKPTSYFQDLRWRDTPSIVVGSTKAWKYTDFGALGNKAYNATIYKSSVYMEMAMLKTYHSHAAEGGKVFFGFDFNEVCKAKGFISPIDYIFIHPHIFLALHKKQNKKTAKYPVLYYPKLVFGFIISKFAKKMGHYGKSTWKTGGSDGDPSQQAIEQYTKVLGNVSDFCYERNLKPVLILFETDKKSQKANDKIKILLSEKYSDIKVVRDAAQLNGYLQGELDK